MGIFYLLALLKGPGWLRLIVLLLFTVMIVFGILTGLHKFNQALERTAPTHVQHHYKPTHVLRG